MSDTTFQSISKPLGNGAIASQLLALAQLLALRGENTFKVKAYRRAAKMLRILPESIEQVVRQGGDLTRYPGIGPAIRSVIEEIVKTGTSGQLQKAQSLMAPEVLELTQYPRLDPKKVQRIYKKLSIASVAGLRDKLESGAIAEKLGTRIAQHIRQGLNPSHEMLLYEADSIITEIEKFLIKRCGVAHAQAVGDCRRRVEIIREISFLVETDNFAFVLTTLQSYGGHADLLKVEENEAELQLSTGVRLRILTASPDTWGNLLILSTGSEDHVSQLRKKKRRGNEGNCWDAEYPTEVGAYNALGLSFVPPELREGRGEVELAATGKLPILISSEDICGELHAHTISSDGANTIEEMALAAADYGYQYIGISDHSQSLKIAGGVSEANLWAQVRLIDQLNTRLNDIRILKSAEVDILLDGSLDYSPELLKELDYTVCSIHSRFGLGRPQQTDRILRAMDNRYFNILGHATGRLLLKRTGYEIDIDRVVEHARRLGCFFEINSSPDRLDLSAENARIVRQAGVKIAITTDAHGVRDFRYLRYGIDQARRAGFSKLEVLNHFSWQELKQILTR